MVDIDQFISQNGTRIKWGRLGEVLVGATIGAFFSGLIRITLRTGDALQALAQGFAEFNAALVQLRFGVLAGVAKQAWRNALSFVLDAGPFAFIVAVALVLATFYVFNVLRPRPWSDDS